MLPDLNVITITMKAAQTTTTKAGDEVFYTYQIYNQAIVVPETIDALHTLIGAEQDGMCSIATTDRALGLVRKFVAPSREPVVPQR